MFWVVTGCTAFCAISLANALLYFAIDRWVFSKSIRSRPFARLLNPERQSRAFWKQLKFVWPVISNRLRQFHWYTRTTTRDVKRSLSGAAKRIFVFLRLSSLGPDGLHGYNDELELGQSLEEGSEPLSVNQGLYPHTRGNEVDISWYSTQIVSLSPRFQEKTERIYDMQFSPNGELLAVCTTFWCYVIDVRPAVDGRSDYRTNIAHL